MGLWILVSFGAGGVLGYICFKEENPVLPIVIAVVGFLVGVAGQVVDFGKSVFQQCEPGGNLAYDEAFCSHVNNFGWYLVAAAIGVIAGMGIEYFTADRSEGRS